MAHFCRTGQDSSSLGMGEERAQIYREMIFSTIQGALNNYYPLTIALLGKEKWEQLGADFFANYPCSNPQFWKMPHGLVAYARESQWGEKHQIPFLADLLDFEWLEVEVYMLADVPLDPFVLNGDVLEDVVYVNPEHRIGVYSYPVAQKISLSDPLKKGVYPVFCYRHPVTLDAHFFSISPFFVTVVELLKQGCFSGREALNFAAEHHRLSINGHLFEVGVQFLKNLIKRSAILGFKVTV